MKLYKVPGSERTSKAQVDYASVLSDDQLEKELTDRRQKNVFPLHVFPSEIGPLLSVLRHKLEGERAFIGQSVLSTVSAAIGSALLASSGGWRTPLTQWSVSVGISSSGKSMIQKILMAPLTRIQERYDYEYQQEVLGGSIDDDDEPMDARDYHKKKKNYFEPPVRRTIFTNDITFETLIKEVMVHNFKGITKYEDEVVKWFDDMNRYKSGGSEISFWTSAWAAPADFTMARSGGKYTVIKKNHLVASVVGGTQPALLYRFFEGDKGYSGFSARFLFALAQEDRVTDPDLTYVIPEDHLNPYNAMIEYLYKELPMNSKEAEPKVLQCTPQAINTFQKWQSANARKINALEPGDEKVVKAGILGKNKEYCLRFAGMLCAMDTACVRGNFFDKMSISSDQMERAIELADYFFQSGWAAYEFAKAQKIIPPEVLQFAALYKHCECNQQRMADAVKVSRQAINKKLTKYMQAYPSAFSAKNT